MKMDNDYKLYIINKSIRSDFRIQLKLLKKAKEGISMNLLTFREPTRGCWTDACEYGLGGFNATGRAWRITLPEHLLHRAHINLLEFLAELVAVWTDILEEDLDPFECFLAGGDSSTAIGWIHRTRAKPDNILMEDYIARQTVARKFAEILIEHDHMFYSQWFQRECWLTKNEQLTVILNCRNQQ